MTLSFASNTSGIAGIGRIYVRRLFTTISRLLASKSAKSSKTANPSAARHMRASLVSSICSAFVKKAVVAAVLKAMLNDDNKEIGNGQYNSSFPLKSKHFLLFKLVIGTKCVKRHPKIVRSGTSMVQIIANLVTVNIT